MVFRLLAFQEFGHPAHLLLCAGLFDGVFCLFKLLWFEVEPSQQPVPFGIGRTGSQLLFQQLVMSILRMAKLANYESAGLHLLFFHSFL